MANSPQLCIDTIRIPGVKGVIGITSCPGVRSGHGSDNPDERLIEDMLAIRVWGADAVMTVLEDVELSALGVHELGRYVETFNMVWLHLPITDSGIQGELSAARWHEAGSFLGERLRAGQQLVIHCNDGVGRAGLAAAQLLTEMGIPVKRAVAAVTKAQQHNHRR